MATNGKCRAEQQVTAEPEPLWEAAWELELRRLQARQKAEPITRLLNRKVRSAMLRHQAPEHQVLFHPDTRP